MATIKDVALKADVTPTTVSRVINNRGYISETTRLKVMDAMKALHYQPNEVARSLSKQRTNTLGVIVPHIVHPYFAKLISHIEEEAAKEKFKILLCCSKEETSKELEYIDMCKSNRVSGIILCSSTVDEKQLSGLNIPLIAVERNIDTGTASISCDNYKGGQLAARHLIDEGCKNILHFSGIIDTNMPADERAEGFINVCEEEHISHLEIQSSEGVYYTMDYHQHIRQALLDNPLVDGIFASSDLIAAQVIQVCHKLGRSIPEQIKLIGFDDVDIATLTTPQITTIHQPIKEMARLCVSYIQKSLNHQEVPVKTVLPVTLITRETT